MSTCGSSFSLLFFLEPPWDHRVGVRQIQVSSWSTAGEWGLGSHRPHSLEEGEGPPGPHSWQGHSLIPPESVTTALGACYFAESPKLSGQMGWGSSIRCHSVPQNLLEGKGMAPTCVLLAWENSMMRAQTWQPMGPGSLNDYGSNATRRQWALIARTWAQFSNFCLEPRTGSLHGLYGIAHGCTNEATSGAAVAAATLQPWT